MVNEIDKVIKSLNDESKSGVAHTQIDNLFGTINFWLIKIYQ